MMAQTGTSPYERLDARAFWRTGLVEAGAYPPPDLYRPRVQITKTTPILTAGSCFAQHVGRALRLAGCNVIDAEPAPSGIGDDLAQRFGYRLYSARCGNIYTVRQLLQLLQEAEGTFTPAEPVWGKDGRYFDALRPNTEPSGLADPEHVREMRQRHLAAVRKAVGMAEVVVFTLGLTEAWEHAETGTVYPTAPGTIAGQMSSAFRFVNFRADAIRADFEAARAILQRQNPAIRFLLTVSPVPLTATASGEHVLAATGWSKAVLRAVAGELVQDYPDIDYFPSYEIVTAPIAKGGMFEPNLRSVRKEAVADIMAYFLAAQGLGGETAVPAPAVEGVLASPKTVRRDTRRKRRRIAGKPKKGDGVTQVTEDGMDDVVCEEALLEAFSR